MTIQDFCGAIERISKKMSEKRQYLIELDQRNGDGDLGISMDDGYRAFKEYLNSSEEKNLGKLINKAADAFNEAAPSSLGTITAFFFKGMAKYLKDKEGECSDEELAGALQSGVDNVFAKAGSKPGEKTILDSICPAIDTFKKNIGKANVWKDVATAAKAGSDSTKNMKAKWGRAAYYTDGGIGLVDGGSVAGALIFEAVADENC